MIGARKSALNQAAEILDKQHKALLHGDLATLMTLAPELEQAFHRLRRDGAAADDIAPLMVAAARNAHLLKAAQAGVAQARGHLQSTRSPDLTTYDAHGRTAPGIPQSSRTLARR
jgi:hypothetical protein